MSLPPAEGLIAIDDKLKRVKAIDVEVLEVDEVKEEARTRERKLYDAKIQRRSCARKIMTVRQSEREPDCNDCYELTTDICFTGLIQPFLRIFLNPDAMFLQSTG